MSIGDRIGNWVDRQISDARDIASFNYENVRGNNPPSPGRRQFMKDGLAKVTAGGLAGYGVSEYLEGGDTDPSSQDDGQTNGGSDGGNSGSSSGNGGSSSGGGSSSDPEVQSINEILGDDGDTDIEIVEDWYSAGTSRGYNADDIATGYNSDQDEHMIAFYDSNGQEELPLVLAEEKGFSDSEVNTILEYEDEGKLAESFRKIKN